MHSSFFFALLFENDIKMIGKKFFSTILIVAIAATIYAQDPHDSEFRESCTSIMVGKKASADGSVITSHTCDGRYRSWMDISPAKKHKKGEVTRIFQGLLFTETPNDTVGFNGVSPAIHDFEIALQVKGVIPEAEETYAFLNTGYPCLNEKNLAIGETTIEGRDTLVNENGLFYIEELERIVLQRCTTAREAIALMGQLVKEYGYADVGECLTVADKNEVWHFEIFGEGPDKIGGVWAAQRIPDDHVGVSANIPRIGELDPANKDYFMASKNVFDVAKKMGFWDGKSTFNFWKAYSGKKPFSIREWFVLSSLAPSLKLSMTDDELPFSVKPEKPVSVRDVLAFFRSTYEGTAYDMTQNLLITKKKKGSEETETVKSPYANPWFSSEMVALFNELKDSTIVRVRAIAVPQCAYGHVIQIRGYLPDEIAGIAYMLNDNPGQSPHVPFYSHILQTPPIYHTSGHKRYLPDTSGWIYRRTNKLATIRWQESRVELEQLREAIEDKLFAEQSRVDTEALRILKEKGKLACQEYLTQYANHFSEETANAWWKLGDELWYTFIRGW
jgi:dipeptidase